MLVIDKEKPGAGTERFAARSPEDLSMGLRGGGEQECPAGALHPAADRAALGQMARIGLREPLYPLRGPWEDVVPKHLSVPSTARASAWLLTSQSVHLQIWATTARH